MTQYLYLHIGTGKTGTTTIQSFLNSNRSYLVKNYLCLYPNTNNGPERYGSGSCRNHLDFFKRADEGNLFADIERIIRYSQKRCIDKIVFSWEGLFDRPRFAKLCADAIFSNNKITPVILLYIRRQDQWLESAWKQWYLKDKKYRDFNHFIDSYHIDWEANLEAWTNTFGKEHIIIQPYERTQLKGGLIQDFLDKLGIDYTSGIWNNLEEEDYNVGFNRDILEILHLNKGFYQDVNDSRLTNMFGRYLPSQFKKKAFESYSLLSPRQRHDIMEKYSHFNEYIAKEFLGRKDGRLFYEPLPDLGEPWKPYEGITIEKCAPIFIQMLYSMDVQFKNYKSPFFRFINKIKRKNG